MFRSLIAATLKNGAVVFLLFTLLFADGIWRTFPSLLGSIINEVSDVFLDPSTQWIVALCLSSYFAVFSFLECRLMPRSKWLRLSNANLWLSALVATVLMRYAFAYQVASSSTQVTILLVSIFCAKVIIVLVRWRNLYIEQRVACLLICLVCFFACASVWQPERAMAFKYHGANRWIGLWDNPNIFGLLMGTGLTLVMGTGIRQCEMVIGRWWKAFSLILFFFAAIVCGYGLFKSYSRGAWLGTACGLAYLFWSRVSALSYWHSLDLSTTTKRTPGKVIEWLCGNRCSLMLIIVSLALLTFWQIRFWDWRPAQRVFSVANANDFSWRNRVAAWNGSLHMMVDRPLMGFGWGQAKLVYAKQYCPLDESAAIEMNDFFMLGISSGTPSLACFVIYLIFVFLKKSTGLGPPPIVITICRGGSIVLLVGFWFDGGLFKLPTATVFWLLIELSRTQLPLKGEVTSIDSKFRSPLAAPHAPSYTKRVWLRWTAGILGATSLLQTVIYVVTPLLPVSKQTLFIARKCLIPPKEIADFDHLSLYPIWQDQKLQTLLENVDLANYNRELINWQLDDTIYRDYVLSPIITGTSDEQLNWRRPLWEEFYPRIRHESSPDDAARIVMRHLRERVTIAIEPNPPHEVPVIWLRQLTDKVGFQTIYVAALRSIGVPARLNMQHQVEFWNCTKWTNAPLPTIVIW